MVPVPLSNFLGRGPGSAQLKKNADGSYMIRILSTGTTTMGSTTPIR